LDAATREIIDAAFTATRGVTERFDRAWYLDAAEKAGSTRDMWQRMADQGLLGLGVPEEYGGLGGGVLGTVAVMEAMSEVGVPSFLYIVTAFCLKAVLEGGTEEQKRRWVEPIVKGQWRTCFALTEPDAGTNSFNMSTRAVKVDGGYRITGQKVYTSGADEADAMIVVARTDHGAKRAEVSLFVVDLPAAGLTMQKLDIEMHAPERQFAVFFDDVFVPDTARIGKDGEGKELLFYALNAERFLIAAWAIGLGNLAIKKGSDYARQRSPFGKPIGSYQAVQHPLARAKIHLVAARTMLYTSCADYDRGETDGLNANMVKYLATTAATLAIEAAIQVHGGYAWDKRSDVIQLWPMIRVMNQTPINNDMLLNYVGERLLDLPRSY
jgi:acyl-CoA dehydrogenase